MFSRERQKVLLWRIHGTESTGVSGCNIYHCRVNIKFKFMFNSPVAIKLTPHFVGSCQNSSLRPTEAWGAENPPALVLESIFLPLHSIHCPELLHSLQLRLSGIYTQDPCNGETTILVYCLLTITAQICLLLPWDCIKNSEWGLCNILVQNMPASTCIFCCKSRLQSKAAAQ